MRTYLVNIERRVVSDGLIYIAGIILPLAARTMPYK